MEFARLTEEHDVSSFDCQNTWLNLYLQNDALAETKRDIARTYVYIDTDAPPHEAVIGYFTLRAEMLVYTSPVTNKVVYSPVAELVYIARNIHRRGTGAGKIMLYEVLRHVYEAAKWLNIAGVSLFATNEGRKLYEDFGFGEHPYGSEFMYLEIQKVRGLVEAPPAEMEA